MVKINLKVFNVFNAKGIVSSSFICAADKAVP